MQLKIKRSTQTAKLPELWREVPGYDGRYEVSNHGRVKSNDMVIFNHLTGNNNFRKGRVLSLQNRNGYLQVRLLMNGVGQTVKVHRLVAESFVKKEKGCNVVNHLDGDKTNNKSENLEWTTVKGNVRHAWDMGLNRFSEDQRRRQKEKLSIKIIGKNIKTGEVLQFDSAAECGRMLNTAKSKIRDCCNGKIEKLKGWVWYDLDSEEGKRLLSASNHK